MTGYNLFADMELTNQQAPRDGCSWARGISDDVYHREATEIHKHFSSQYNYWMQILSKKVWSIWWGGSICQYLHSTGLWYLWYLWHLWNSMALSVVFICGLGSTSSMGCEICFMLMFFISSCPRLSILRENTWNDVVEMLKVFTWNERVLHKTMKSSIMTNNKLQVTITPM